MKKLTLIVLLALSSHLMFGQEVISKPGRKLVFANTSWCDNWFVGLGGGAVTYLDGNAFTHFGELLTAQSSLFAGKWINPYVGVRLNINNGPYSYWHRGNDAEGKREQLAALVDVLLNLTSYFAKWKEDRIYNLVPYVGAGYIHGFRDTWKASHNNSFTANAGLLNTFRVAKNWELYIDLSAMIMDDQFNDYVGGDYNWEGMLSLNAGVIYKIGGAEQQRVVGTNNTVGARNATAFFPVGYQGDDDKSKTYTPLYGPEGKPAAAAPAPVAIEPAPATDDESQRLREQIAELQKTIDSLKNAEPKVVEKIVEVPGSAQGIENVIIVFKINETKVAFEQEVNVYSVAQIMKKYSNLKVDLKGYADKKTGTAAINEKLSRQRAEGVAKMLTGKYGIASERIQTSWVGDSEQAFPENGWNRAVIVTFE